MNKLSKEASIFFQKNQENTAKEFQKKELSLDIFSVTLSDEEHEKINNLVINEDEKLDVNHNLAAIKLLTIQIKSIQKQHVLLIGEKIYKVREILREMRSPETTFSSWINLVFHTKSSAYNALGYYELFISLPDKHTKSLFQSIPYKTAYLLASRKGSIKEKITVLGKIRGMSNTLAISVLNQFLPSLRSNDELQVNDVEKKNKFLSSKLIEVLEIINSGINISEYNKNLIHQLIESISYRC
ncbi:CT583 family protein [Chlamydia gallinacea]|uniref:Virulence factor n=2 Tax=Chlamydia gallinacea TaxID=1457153 RepID=A0A173E092_9CHLA|nr:CT583 family protein [Chlamydia gallinacea]ANG66610.1 virulence factor [Chlamydia gallinacea 08-1274/3]AQT77963.1 virulence factor [Chlamydia gallinacea]MBX6680606.1 CT583 family protein [Chlamydia gallinacea]MBX6687962.1 CT583 family protein [Chlamydia gallinacea]